MSDHMARHGNTATGGSSGIDSITPPTGMMTGVLAFTAAVSAVWMVIKHPRVASYCLLFAALLVMLSGAGSPITHPFIGLLALGLGAWAHDLGTRNKPPR